MNRISVLRLADKKKRIKNINYEEFEAYSLLTVKNSKRSIKKVLKRHEDETIVVSNDSIGELALQGYVKPYNELSTEVVLEIIEKVCREVALKHGLKLPLEDIYLYASPKTACEFIKRIIGISRIYTIVSKEEGERAADNIYFEYGYPIRRVEKPDLNNGEDVIAIFIEECGNINSRIINITKNKISGANVVDVREITVLDEDIKELTKSISERVGLSLLTILEKKPSGNVTIDINKKADPIFLLDTKTN